MAYSLRMAHVSVEPVKHIVVELDGVPIAETSHGFVVHEEGLSDRYYLPRDDVRAVLSDGKGAGHCPWKGDWKHLDVEAVGKKVPNGAWTYHTVFPVTERVKDFVAFYDGKFRIVVS